MTVCISCYLNFANGAYMYLIQLTDLFFAASSVIMYLSITFNPIFLKIFFLTVSMFVLLKCCKKYFLMTTNVTSTLVLYLVVSVYFICQIQHNFSLQHSRIAICLSRCLFYIITLWLVHILVLYLYGSVIEALIHILCWFLKLVTSWLICLCVCDDVHYFCLLFSN